MDFVVSVFFKDDDLTVSTNNGIAHFDFHAEKTKNAISFATAKQLSTCIGKHGATPAFLNWLINNKCGVLMLRSLVKDVFVSGGDVKELQESQPQNAAGYAHAMREFCMGLTKINLPSVTLLSGGAFGGGAELALATDFRFLTVGGALHLRQCQWGVPGGWHGMVRLGELTGCSPRKVGLWFATAATFDADQLMQLRICDARFMTSNEAFVSIQHLSDRFLACDLSLRDALLRRGQDHSSLAESDATLFASFWMGPMHIAKLAEYKARRSKS